MERIKVLLVISDVTEGESVGIVVVNFPIVPLGAKVTIYDGDICLFEEATVCEYHIYSDHGLIVNIELPCISDSSKQQYFEDVATLCTAPNKYCGRQYPIAIIIP